MTDTVGRLGEQAVLARVLQQLRTRERVALGPGDDCAVLDTDQTTVVTTDTMIEGHDFRLDWHPPEQLGWKLAATNLSDVAAMGAIPIALTLALACPPDTPVAVLEGIARGMQTACDTLAPGCAVAGGDLAQAPVMIGAVTALGTLEGRAAITRTGAQSGEQVVYVGQLGLAGVGLRTLLAEGPEASRTASVAVAAHLAPHAPISSGPALALAGATAMMDVSDGLSLDAARLGEASGVTLDLSSDALVREFGRQQGEPVPLDLMLAGGEDHGLLATVPDAIADAGLLPEGVKTIGRVVPRGPSLLLDGVAYTPRGWDTFVT